MAKRNCSAPLTLSDEIDTFIGLVEGWELSTLDCERADRQLELRGFSAAVLNRLADTGRERADYAIAVSQKGEQLSRQLVVAGHDPSGVLRVVHFTSDIASGARAFDWVAIKTELWRIAIEAVAGDGEVLFLGGGRYQVGDKVTVLTGAQADVLQALVELQGASLDELRTHSGAPNPAIALKQICKSYPLLSPFITLPGGKGKGGYSTTIRPAS